jgi:hypothetical protein
MPRPVDERQHERHATVATQPWSRRALLERAGLLAGLAVLGATAGRAAGAAGTAEVAGTGAPAATTPDALRRFLALRARLDGRPVFAIARGTDLAIVDGRSIPLRGNLILQATRAIDLGDGSWALPYVETTLVTEHGSFVHRPEWTNPLTGASAPVPKPQVSLAHLRMDARGALSNHLEVPGGLVVDYDGVVASQAGLEGAAWATQTLHLHFRRPGGGEEDAYVTTTLMQTGAERRGFLPADSNSVSSRPRISAALSGGRAGSQLSTFFGRKYDSPDRLRRSLDPAHRAPLAPFFDQWQALLP